MSMIMKQVEEVLKIEAQAILDLIERISPAFETVVEMILNSKGRVILTGMGKSGLVGRKISATLNSTGTPSLFLHPAEATHGDLGMVTGDDIVLVISNSGQTSEIIRIIPIVKNIGAKVVALTGGLDSPIAQESDAVIDVGVEREACPMGLAPTASTTAALAMGDALAVVLINSRRFDQKDFKRFHPAGSLGERLSVKVKEIMHTGDHIPLVVRGTGAEHAIREMDAKDIGATLVLDEEGRLEGIITDGDLRRALITKDDIRKLKVEEIMSPKPKTVEADQTAAEAIGLMELYGITHLVILNRRRKVQGVVHLHDLLGREDFRLNGASKLATRPDPRPDHSA